MTSDDRAGGRGRVCALTAVAVLVVLVGDALGRLVVGGGGARRQRRVRVRRQQRVLHAVGRLLARVHQVRVRARQPLQLAVAARLLLAVLAPQRAARPLQRQVLLLGGAVRPLQLRPFI